MDISGDGLQIDAALAWTMDFAEAEKAGMGFRLQLDADTAATGLDELIVLGVEGSLAPGDVVGRLAELLDGHHYERGLCFVKQGTPTNNTSAAPSGYPPDDPDGAPSFAVERGPPLAAPGASGDLVARALGIDAEVFDHIEGADRDEQAGARAMSRPSGRRPGAISSSSSCSRAPLISRRSTRSAATSSIMSADGDTIRRFASAAPPTASSCRRRSRGGRIARLPARMSRPFAAR